MSVELGTRTIVTVTLNPAVDVCVSVPWVEPERKLHCSDARRAPERAV